MRPESSGVYGLFSALCVYIGEAENLRDRLLEHLAGDNPGMVHYQPSSFVFELVSPTERRCRHEELTKRNFSPCAMEKHSPIGPGRNPRLRFDTWTRKHALFSSQSKNGYIV